MNRTTLYLLIGTALLVSGLALTGVSVFSVAKQFLNGAALINGTPLSPGNTTDAVMKSVPAGQQLALTISENPAGVPLSVKVIGPDGNAIARYDNLSSATFASRTIETSVAGDQTLEITNAGSKSVAVSGVLINAGQVGSNSQLPGIVSLGFGILAGFALIIAGIVMLIIGAIMYARGRRKHSPSPAGPAA